MISTILKGLSANPVLAPWLTGLQAFWPLLWRLLVLAICFGAGWHYGGKSAEQELAQAKARFLEAHLNSVLALRDEQSEIEKQSREVEAEYERSKQELEDIRRAIPVRSVRLCPPASGGGVPGVPAAAGKSAGGAANPPFVSGAPGPDIGGRLYALADECDDIARRLTGMLQWTTQLHELTKEREDGRKP